MIKLKFKALTLRNYRISIILIILSILIPVSIFMFIVISNNILDLKLYHIIFIMGFFGFLSFLFFGVFTYKFLSRDFEMIFNQNNLLIISGRSECHNYADINTITIHNNTEYSKIIIHRSDGKKLKFL